MRILLSITALKLPSELLCALVGLQLILMNPKLSKLIGFINLL